MVAQTGGGEVRIDIVLQEQTQTQTGMECDDEWLRSRAANLLR